MQHQHAQPDLTRTKEQATEKKSQVPHPPNMCNQKNEKHMQLQSNQKNPFLSFFPSSLEILGWPKRQIKLRHRNKENNMELCTIWSLKRMKDAWSLYTAHLFIWSTWITFFFSHLLSRQRLKHRRQHFRTSGEAPEVGATDDAARSAMIVASML